MYLSQKGSYIGNSSERKELTTVKKRRQRTITHAYLRLS